VIGLDAHHDSPTGSRPSEPLDLDAVLTCSEAAKHFGRSTEFFRRHAAAGHVPLTADEPYRARLDDWRRVHETRRQSPAANARNPQPEPKAPPKTGVPTKRGQTARDRLSEFRKAKES